MMMWLWGADGSLGWLWIVGPAVMMIFCMLMMPGMMRHGRSHSRIGEWDLHRPTTDTAERLLANRLASGEIDVDEYERLRDALRQTAGSLDLERTNHARDNRHS